MPIVFTACYYKTIPFIISVRSSVPNHVYGSRNLGLSEGQNLQQLSPIDSVLTATSALELTTKLFVGKYSNCVHAYLMRIKLN